MLAEMFQIDEIIYLVVLCFVFANGLYLNYIGKTENKLTMLYISYFIYFVSAIFSLIVYPSITLFIETLDELIDDRFSIAETIYLALINLVFANGLYIN